MEKQPEKIITFKAIWPGLLFILALNLGYIFGREALRGLILSQGYIWMALFLAFPLAYIIARRASLRELGYRGADPFRLYARGVAAGVLWRFFDLLAGYYGLFNFLERKGEPSSQAMLTVAPCLSLLFSDLFLTPLLEDTFFRGFLQPGLEERCGPLLAIVVQAVLFSTHPYHVVQSPDNLPRIFLFGLIAGLLYWRTRSLIPIFGAHGWANLLPKIIRAIAGAVY